MTCRPTIEGSLALGILELSPVPLSPEEIATNFNVDVDEVAPVFDELEQKELVERVRGDVYWITERGSMRVEMRGGE